MEKDLQVVGFRIGKETYGVRIAAVREIVRVPEITAVPSAPDLIEGVINLRGKIIPVMDLRKRFGQAQIQLDNKNAELFVGVNLGQAEAPAQFHKGEDFSAKIDHSLPHGRVGRDSVSFGNCED